jgi:hypothetical protein
MESRCDRILWKSTVDPDPEIEEDYHDTHIRPRTRVGQFFANAFRPLSARVRKDSHSSMSSIDISAVPVKTDVLISSSPANGSEDLVSPFSYIAQNKTKRLHHSKSNDNLTLGKVELLGRDSCDTNLLPPHNHPHLSPVNSDCPPRIDTQIPTSGFAADSFHQIAKELPALPVLSRWRFFPFLSREGAAPTNTPADRTVDASPPPQKGEVICLSYTSLDDRGMRRLEGRSDHRPVIGSYAIYL